MSEFTILIMDDSRYIARLIQMKLTKLNWKVSVEHNPRALFRTMQKIKPNLILMDVILPGTNGFALCEAIRKTPAPVGTIPIIIHSSRATKTDILQARRSGANNYIVKPATIQTIIEKIEVEMKKTGRSVVGSSSNMEDVVHSIFKPDMSNDDRMAAILKAAGEIKAMPQAVHRTLKVTGDQRTGAGELAHVVTSDSAISAMVLKKANTVHFGKSEPIVNIQEAIVRIGFSETKNLVLGLSVINNFDKERKSLGFSRLSFWEHSLAVGIIAKILATQTKLFDSHYAFVAGLLHDIGKMVLDEYATDDFDQALELASRKNISLRAAERETYTITHNEIGQSLIEKWLFPPSIQKSTMFHNNVAEAEASVIPEDLPLVKLVALANILAKAMRFGQGGDSVLEEVSPELTEWAQLTDGISDEMIETVNREIEEFKEFIKIPSDLSAGDFITAPKNIPNRIYYFISPTRPVDPIRMYFKRSGYDVVSCTPEEANASIQDDQPGIFLWNSENDIDMEEIAPALQPLPAETPVLIFMKKKFAINWNDAPERPNTFAFAKSPNGSSLLQRILEMQKSIFGEGEDEKPEDSQPNDETKDSQS